ncbi:MAG: beta-galactosidase, partial [Clostridia bacterium]|nr:beta-galactosidase [Clostridia bacterium]
RRRDQVLNPTEDFSRAGYHLLCFNTPYLDTLIEQVKEVCVNYEADGLFLDITAPRVCYCKYCMKTLTERGLDPMDEKNAHALSEETYVKYTSAIRQAADSIKPGIPIFHNSGSTPRGRRDIEHMSSHNEIESLPTSSWGYDNLPMIAHYVQSHDLDYLGMTGKFHLSWGEFGGYKHPNALKWETALTVAHGAKCSIGDQLHPLGNMDPATYRLIGEAYAEIQQKEPWLDGVKAVTDIGLLSYDAWLLRHPGEKANDKDASRVDVGALRILLEGKYLFDILDEESDFSSYKLLILPDNIRIDGDLRQKLDTYIADGGKLLASGKSGLAPLPDGSYQFAYDFGACYEGTREISPIYITPQEQIDQIGIADQVLYAPSERITLCGGTALASIKEPYFDRTAEHFCSHRHAPQDHSKVSAGVTEGKDGIYIAEHIFREYAMVGSQFAKQLVFYAIDRCLGTSKTLRTALPAQAIVTLMDQPEQKRLVLHVVYAPRNVKGINKIEV